MTLLDYIKRQAELSKMDLPTREKFGELMHDDNLTDEEKYKIIEQVEKAGGYECLENA